MSEFNLNAVEQQVLSIYLNCQELLFEDRIEPAFFENPIHQTIYRAILKSLKHGEYDASIYYSLLDQETLHYANQLESSFTSRSQLDNLLKPLQTRFVVSKSQDLLQKVIDGELDILDVSNTLSSLSIKYSTTDWKATPVTMIEEKEPNWLIPNLIEKNEITIFGGDGGCGKTTVITNLIAALSSGSSCFFEEQTYNRPKYKILYFSKEDGTAETLKRKFRLQGANMSNLATFDLDDTRLQSVLLGTSSIETLVRINKPDILVFDPLESFIDSTLNMGARNQMRRISDSLRAISKKFKVTVFLIMHTNKESKVWGRKRLADSSDFWDASRSVFLFGETENKGINYIAHEKHNHSPRQNTILFSVTREGIATFEGESEKTDKDYVLESTQRQTNDSKIELALTKICELLEDKDLTFKEIVSLLKPFEISERTAERAKKQLQKDNKIDSYKESLGKGKGSRCLYTLVT